MNEQIIEFQNGGELDIASFEAVIPLLETGIFARHAPWAHYLLQRDDRILARCSAWAEGTPVYGGNPVGVIGHYAALDGSAGAQLLGHAAEQLRQRGFRAVVGPMDGNTWRKYRLMTTRGAEPVFFMEPDNPDDWPGHFLAAGFEPVAKYFSAVNEDLSVVDPRARGAMDRLTQAGVRVRQIDAARFEEELKAVHELSVEAFVGNFLYTPIDQAEFLAMYAPIREHLRPELVLLAEREAQLVGFMFGLPDLMQAKRGERITTAIAKSLAVRPGRTGAGLGSVLMDQFQQAARKLGFERVIHALMHESNRSMKISDRYGKPFRQYTLYIKEFDAIG
jgi:predicted N-acetyltransferase YhbS